MARSRESYVEMGKLGAIAKWSKQPPYEKRFWNRVGVKSQDECWEWKRGLTNKGYGKVKKGNKCLLAHRLAYELSKGTIPYGLCVLHRCDNPPCCNPSHLWLGTLSDNIRDAIRKGRKRGKQLRFIFPSKYGGNRKKPTITQDVENSIKAGYNGGKTQAELSAQFAVHQSTISRIVNGLNHYRQRKLHQLNHLS